jgi:hypothetical protein
MVAWSIRGHSPLIAIHPLSPSPPSASVTREVIDRVPAGRDRPGHDHIISHPNGPPRAPGPGQRESLGTAADRPCRHLHGRPGLLHRQRRAALHAGPAACLRRRDRGGRRRLQPHLGGPADHRRTPWRPPRTPTRLRARPGPVHPQLGRLWPGHQPRDADRRPSRPGRRRRAADAQHPVAHRRALRRRRPSSRTGRLWHDDGTGRRLRPAHRRRAHAGRHRRPRLADGVSHQRTGGAGRPGAHAAPDSRVAGGELAGVLLVVVALAEQLEVPLPMLEGVAPELLVPPVNTIRLALHPDGVAPRIIKPRFGATAGGRPDPARGWPSRPRCG